MWQKLSILQDPVLVYFASIGRNKIPSQTQNEDHNLDGLNIYIKKKSLAVSLLQISRRQLRSNCCWPKGIEWINDYYITGIRLLWLRILKQGNYDWLPFQEKKNICLLMGVEFRSPWLCREEIKTNMNASHFNYDLIS